MSKIPERFAGIRMRQIKSAEPAAEVEPDVEQDTNPRFPGIRMRQIKPAAEEAEPKVEQENPELPPEQQREHDMRNRAAEKLGISPG